MDSRLKLVISKEIDSVEWDKKAAYLGGAFFHCYASAIYGARLIGGEPLFVEARDETNTCVGIAVGSLVTSKKWPFSKYCGIASFSATPIAAGDNEVEGWLLKNVERHLRQLGVFRIEFASYHSHNSADLLSLFGYQICSRYEYEFDLTKNEDDLFGAFSSNKRNEIRKAEKNRIITKIVNSSDAVELVEKMHNLSMERRGGNCSSETNEAVATRLNLFDSRRTQILVSFLNKDPVCAYLFGVFNGCVYGLRSGSSESGNKYFAPVHLSWTAIKHFKNEGCAVLSLGGARQEESGLRKFKLKMGTIESSQPSGYKIISNVGAYLDYIRKKIKGY